MSLDINPGELELAKLGLDPRFVDAGATLDFSATGNNEVIYCIMPQFKDQTVLLDTTSILLNGETVPDLLAGTKDSPIYGGFSKIVLDATSNDAICYVLRGKVR